MKVSFAASEGRPLVETLVRNVPVHISSFFAALSYSFGEGFEEPADRSLLKQELDGMGAIVLDQLVIRYRDHHLGPASVRVQIQGKEVVAELEERVEESLG